MIFYWAKAAPERLAIIQHDVVVTYRALADAIESVCERIDRFDLGRGTPVAVAIRDASRLLAVCFALLRRGIMAVPIGRDTLPHLVSNGIITVIGDDESFSHSGGRHIRFDDSWLRGEHKIPLTPAFARKSLADQTSLVLFTSGTTGEPKKTILPSGIFLERLKLLPIVGEGASERVLVAAGLSSSFGFVRAAMVLHQGKTACFAYTPESQLLLIQTYNVEVLVASPQQALVLVQFVEKSAKHRLDTLREVRLAGGSASNELVRRLQRRLCHNVTVKYGATEAGPIAVGSSDIVADVQNAVGFPLPGVEIEIVDAANMVLPAGEEGLVRCRSEYFTKVFAANHRERSSEANDVWWYPGDIGSLTTDGLLCIGGRTDDVINSGGVKISAPIIDDAIRSYPGIKDAGVCSVRGASGVDQVWIGIVADREIDLLDLTRWIDEKYAFRASLGEILVVEQIPRNDLGKLQRNKLKELLLTNKSRRLAEV